MICKGVDTSGLQLLTGFLDAVSISGELEEGIQVCFRDSGSLIFLDTMESPPRLTELTSYHLSDMTCGWTDQVGTVVLVASALPVTATDGNTNTSAIPLPNCKVVTTTRVNFRATPAGNQVGAVIPYNTRFTATAKSVGWYNVLNGGQSGWISGDYVDAEGTC